MDSVPIYLNITSEGARINPQNFDGDEHAMMMFMSWHSNNTVVQALVMGSEKVKYYFNTGKGERQWREEEALMVRFGSLIGHIPLSESGLRSADQFPRLFNRYIAVMPDRFNPGTGERPLFLFSRQRAIEAMRTANLPKITPGTTWTGVISRRLEFGYMVDVGGFNTWLPLSLVDFNLVQAHEMPVGEMVMVKVMPQRSGKTIVVSRKDAMENPYDMHKGKYQNGGNVVGQVRVVQGLNGYAVLHDGVNVRFRRGGEREMFRAGSWVSLRITGKADDEKVLIGTVQAVINQPVA